MMFQMIRLFIQFHCILQFVRFCSSDEIECDPISDTNYAIGPRLCFIRHMNQRILHDVTYKPNSNYLEKREIIFDNCTLDALPLGIFEHYPNVKTMYVWNIHLKNMTKEMFRNADELVKLDLSKNHIGQLESDTFSLTTKLAQLDLSMNRIKSMHVDAFSGLGRLNILNLANNQLQLIPANCFAPLRQLKMIRLNQNSIKMIPVELFAHNIRLQNIYLNDNAIEWLFGEQTFRHLSDVNEFDLHNNPIVNFANCVINAQSIDIRQTNAMGCYIGSRTKRILASDNRIAFIDSDDAPATNLEHVELANNRLPGMLNLTRFENLSYLNLKNNRIHDIGLNSFARMHRLEVLNLQNSGVSKIYFGLFSHKSKLRVLDLSYNELGHIDFRMFVAMKSLIQLHLDGNNLNVMDATEVRRIFPALQQIGISRNDWSCHNLASIVKHLESNGIAINSIDSTKNTENIKGIPCSSGDDGGDGGSETDINVNEIATERNVITTESSEIEKSQEIRAFTTNDINERLHYDQWSNGSDMHLMLRLLELKYDVQNTVQSANEVARKLDSILRLS